MKLNPNDKVELWGRVQENIVNSQSSTAPFGLNLQKNYILKGYL